MASGHHIIGYGSSPSRHGPVQHACWRWPTMRSPGLFRVRRCVSKGPGAGIELALADGLAPLAGRCGD